MKCPNCKQPFIEERPPKFHCSKCGWLEKIDKEWKNCEAPESPAPQEPEPDPEPEPEPTPEPDPAAHEPDPAANEPDPAAHEPDPAANEPTPVNVTKSYLGGLVTVTEVDG